MSKVSLFVHDLSSNPIVRAAPIGKALESAGYEVEVLGLLIKGQEIYAPYRETFSYRTRRSSLRPTDVFCRGRELARLASGDVFYAFKPLWTTYYPALLASQFGRAAPLLLDAEDEELVYRRGNLLATLAAEPFLGWSNARSFKYTLLLHALKDRAHAVSVVSSKLQERYGGRILLHGPTRDVGRLPRGVFDFSSRRIRQRFSLPFEAPIVGFAGIPREHKGLDTVVEALRRPAAHSYHLALAGPSSHPAFIEAESLLGDRCHIVGLLDQREMPDFLAAIDVVPAVQSRNRTTEAQVPAKILEAMAAARIVVASRVGDLPRILGSGSADARGWLVEPGRPDQLVQVLEELWLHPQEAQERAERARQYLEEEASVECNATRAAELVEHAVSRFQSISVSL